MKTKIVTLVLSLAAGCAAHAKAPEPLSQTIGECRAGDDAACARVAGQLESTFAGRAAADRVVGRKLASTAVNALRLERTLPDEQLARVLGGLFAGDDARLD